MNAGATLRISQHRISACIHKYYHGFEMALSGRPVQGGGVQFAAPGVHFGPLINEEMHDFFAIVDGGPVEEGDGFIVSLVDIVAGVDELFYACECPIL